MSDKRYRKLRGRRASRLLIFLRKASYWLVATVAKMAFGLLRLLPVDTALDTADRIARRVGPWFGRHRTALDNLRRAYPDKSEAEIAEIASDMWGNMARLATEYIFLDRLFDFHPHDMAAGRIEVVGIERFLRVAAEEKPHIIFTGHIGNFELLPIGGAAYGMKVTSLFRPPNNPYIAEYILSKRQSRMSGLVASDSGAAFALAGILERGGNIGMLVDQRFINGVPTTFFGRNCETNPTLAMLARRFDCDIYPAHCVRLPGNRYRLTLEEKLEPARDKVGGIDIMALTQQLNDTVERWVRETPGQWMWFHKRWRQTEAWRKKTRRRWSRPAE